MGEGGGGEEKGRFLSFTSLPFSLPFFPFSPETPDTQANDNLAVLAFGFSPFRERNNFIRLS